MDCGIEKLVWFIKATIIKLTVDPVTFVLVQITKFVLVLALAFWITVGIFLMWEGIMPETARRLSATAAAVVGNSAGLLPKDEYKDITGEQGNYPYIVDLPKATSSTMEKDAKKQTTIPSELQSEEPGSYAKNPLADPPSKAPVDVTLDPEATSTPKNSAAEVGDQETAVVSDKQPEDQPSIAAE
ncbi:uncharacterized protein [Eurosta solidaginis]|uniref:uncharacterized protein n=1 Tax=Eurosta solidaginis TaxID=178769 RepID=UPI0035313EF0